VFEGLHELENANGRPKVPISKRSVCQKRNDYLPAKRTANSASARSETPGYFEDPFSPAIGPVSERSGQKTMKVTCPNTGKSRSIFDGSKKWKCSFCGQTHELNSSAASAVAPQPASAAAAAEASAEPAEEPKPVTPIDQRRPAEAAAEEKKTHENGKRPFWKRQIL
jgi:ribosomal protein L37AE/L43A